MSRFQRMLDRHADLRENPNEMEVREMFDILLRYCPEVTRFPLITGNEVRAMLAYPQGIGTESVKNMVETQAAIDQHDIDRNERVEPSGYTASYDSDDELFPTEGESDEGEGGEEDDESP